MEQQNLLGAVEPEVVAKLNKSYDEISRGRTTSSAVAAGLAMASVPIALAALARDAFAVPPTTVVGVLQFALTLEYLESSFYNTGLASATLLATGSVDRTVFTQIAKHENAHVTFLSQTITALGATPVARPTFDFTAGGTYANVFTSLDTFRAVAQAFEDTGVRAYKGQAPILRSNPNVLTAALRIHSVEARHAARVRMLRGERPWIPLTQVAVPAGTTAVYAGEENTTQGAVAVTTPSAEVGARAFDEPLTYAQVIAIANPFIVSPKLT
jgi:rubrerythrin